MPADSTPAIAGIGTVIVPVADQDRALEFYVDVLGFEKRLDAPFGQGRWIEVAPTAAVTTIALVSPRGSDPSGIIVSFASPDARAAHATLRSRGVQVSELLDFGPGVPPMFTFRDLDGTEFRVVERAGV